MKACDLSCEIQFKFCYWRKLPEFSRVALRSSEINESIRFYMIYLLLEVGDYIIYDLKSQSLIMLNVFQSIYYMIHGSGCTIGPRMLLWGSPPWKISGRF